MKGLFVENLSLDCLYSSNVGSHISSIKQQSLAVTVARNFAQIAHKYSNNWLLPCCIFLSFHSNFSPNKCSLNYKLE